MITGIRYDNGPVSHHAKFIPLAATIYQRGWAVIESWLIISEQRVNLLT